MQQGAKTDAVNEKYDTKRDIRQKWKETQNRMAEKKAETQATQTATTVHRKVAATMGQGGECRGVPPIHCHDKIPPSPQATG